MEAESLCAITAIIKSPMDCLLFPMNIQDRFEKHGLENRSLI